MDRELPTFATQATTEWEIVLALVSLQEGGLGVHLPVHVCCYCMQMHGGGGWGPSTSGIGKGIQYGGLSFACKACGKSF